MENRILFATTNKHKERIFKESWKKSILSEKYSYVTLRDMPVDIDIEEDSGTFEGDALKKAIVYGQHSGMITISQDRGFVFDELNWPGTLSKEVMFGDARLVVGEDGKPMFGDDSDEHNGLERAKKVLSRIDGKDRTMSVINATAIYLPSGESFVENTVTKGMAALKPFEGLEESFSTFFVPQGETKTMNELYPNWDLMLDYWSTVLAPIPENIEDKVNEFRVN